MKRTIKTYEHFYFPTDGESNVVKSNHEGDKRTESFINALEQGDIDAVRFDSDDEKKLAALVKSLGHKMVLATPAVAKTYLGKGPIYVIQSKYYYQPSNHNNISDETGRKISIDDLIDRVGENSF